jgi:hypothetical protein
VVAAQQNIGPERVVLILEADLLQMSGYIHKNAYIPGVIALK